MRTMLPLLVGLIIAGGFLYLTYRFLPLGIALVITGACLATLTRTTQEKITHHIGLFGSWLYPVGIILTFIFNGWVLGLLSIVIGLIAYRYAKQ
jgi:hypothetical protein